jgi:hypothetical protein
VYEATESMELEFGINMMRVVIYVIGLDCCTVCLFFFIFWCFFMRDFRVLSTSHIQSSCSCRCLSATGPRLASTRSSSRLAASSWRRRSMQWSAARLSSQRESRPLVRYVGRELCLFVCCFCLFVCLFVCLSVCLSVCLFVVCLYLFVEILLTD